MKNLSIIHIYYIFLILVIVIGSAKVVSAENTEPVLSDMNAYTDYEDTGPEYYFNVIYTDADGEEGTVLLYIDSNDPVTMRTLDQDPAEGQYYEVYITDLQVTDDSEFYFTADDGSGNLTYLPPEDDDPYLFGDFDGWGEPPVLSEPDVYFDGDDWVFNVTYFDPDGDEAENVYLILDDEVYIYMDTDDPDPDTGQNYIVRVLESDVNESTEFYFSADDENGSYSDLYDEGTTMFVVADFEDDGGSGNGGGGGGSGDGKPEVDGGGGTSFLEGWLDNPEVVVGLIGVFILVGGSAFGVFRRKKKQHRFSDLLTKLDDIYTSFKMNPQRCETELKKIKSTINEDLKKGVIDENNYTILKDRVDEILGEIKSE